MERLLAAIETCARWLERDEVHDRIERLRSEIEQLREVGAAAIPEFKLALPKELVPSTAEIIASLYMILVHALLKEKCAKLLAELENCKKFALVRHKQSLLSADVVREQRTSRWQSDAMQQQP